MRKMRRLRVIKNILGFLLAVTAVLILVWLIRDGHGRYSPIVSKTAAGAGISDLLGGASGLECESAVAIDMDSGKVLYAKNSHEKLYPASLTKLMTALLLSEHAGRNDPLTYTAKAKAEPSNKMDFPAGSKLTADNAMKALLIFSANDVATAVAEHVSGSVTSFAALMNQKAWALGMKDTHFANANGLSDRNHYTSAYDIGVLARRAYRVPWILDTMKKPSALVKTGSGKGITVYNTNKALGKNGCFAGKTGNTEAAGWCLAAFYRHNGKTVLGVVLKSPTEDSLYQDMPRLIALAGQTQ